MSRRKLVLEEMGIAPLWRLRDVPGQLRAGSAASNEPGMSCEASTSSAPDAEATGRNVGERQAEATEAGGRAGGGVRGDSSDGRRRESAQAEGVAREGPQATATAAAKEGRAVPPSVPPADAGDAQGRRDQILRMDWGPLKAAVSQCVACPLHRTRTQTVFGVGDENADWLFVGEGPGADEDAKGEPFVGQAGRLLDSMLAAIDLKRGDNVYIANVVKCRPPNNRNPEEREMSCCEPYLARQIELIKPSLIVSLGRVSANHLLQTDASIASLRGRVHQYRGTPLIVTYHPAYLLRSLQEKAKAWVDLCFARQTMSSIRAGRRASA